MTVITAPSRSLPDVVATVAILVFGAIAGAVGILLAVSLIFVSDSCGASGVNTCSSGQLLIGILIAAALPPLTMLGMGIFAIVRLVRRGRAWWVAAIGLVGAAAFWFAGAALAVGSNPGFRL